MAPADQVLTDEVVAKGVLYGLENTCLHVHMGGKSHLSPAAVAEAGPQACQGKCDRAEAAHERTGWGIRRRPIWRLCGRRHPKEELTDLLRNQPSAWTEYPRVSVAAFVHHSDAQRPPEKNGFLSPAGGGVVHSKGRRARRIRVERSDCVPPESTARPVAVLPSLEQGRSPCRPSHTDFPASRRVAAGS